MSPIREAVHIDQSSLEAAMSQHDLLSQFRINGDLENPGKISGIDITNTDTIVITDSWKQTITIYDQMGRCQFTKTFDHNVWDCACLGNGYFAVLADDCIKVFTNKWSFCQKIRVSLPNPRQLTADSDGFFIVLDAGCKTVATYHAKSGSLLSSFPTACAYSGYVQFAAEDSQHLRRGHHAGRAASTYEPMGTGLAVNSKDFIYIADTAKNSVKVYTHYGARREDLNFPTDAESKFQLARPLGLCIGAQDSIIVADSDNDRVVKFSADWAECETILSKEDGLVKPVAVAMTASKSLVIVDGETNAYIVKCE